MVKSITYYPKPVYYSYAIQISADNLKEIHPKTKEDRKRLVKEIQDKDGVISPYHGAITITDSAT